MNEKATKEMITKSHLLDKIDLLVELIDADVSNFVSSIDVNNNPLSRKSYRKKSNEWHNRLIQAAKEFSNEREI